VDVIALGDIKKCVGAKVDEIYKTMDHAENPLIMESFSQGVLNELYELVMQPVVEVLPDEVENLYLVPDSDLFRLPLALLLGGSYVISYAPVSALLDARIRKHAGQNAGTGEALVFGDPVDRGAEGDTSKQVESGKAGSLRFGRIAHSGDEARLVSKLLMPARLFTGTEATLRAFRENARDARVIHLATHGMTDRVNPQYSGILFSGDDKNHGGNFLHAFEISEMRIQAGLVVLSGCSTGRGKLSNSEGILGLARAFLLSGAQAVLVTLWNVSDESSHIFMEEFYKCYAVENHNASRAVLKAQAELRKSRFNHPYFWAPYVLYGSA
jgi:CHAT domain-containing protein